MSLPKAAPPRARHCTYCPEPAPDCCVRTQGDQHIYAHRTCAAGRGEKPLYVLLPEGGAR